MQCKHGLGHPRIMRHNRPWRHMHGGCTRSAPPTGRTRKPRKFGDALRILHCDENPSARYKLTCYRTQRYCRTGTQSTPALTGDANLRKKREHKKVSSYPGRYGIGYHGRFVGGEHVGDANSTVSGQRGHMEKKKKTQEAGSRPRERRPRDRRFSYLKRPKMLWLSVRSRPDMQTRVTGP